ncbi:MAG TPA: IPT/TIG domain-containing protein [Longimicrobium sp.]|nr:IPT/TIG domain-containing protein [Longimicrobium sp.]
MSNAAAPARRQVSFRTLVGFVVYFMALLPLALWGLWSLVAANTIYLPNASVLAGLPPGTVLRDTTAFLLQSAESRLVLDHGELLLAVMLAGGIGSYIHGVNSFVTYVGNRSFVPSWVPWYLLRPFMGIGMAVIFYVVVRGGVLVMSGGVSTVDPYAMMTVAALAGMFSKQASDKLAEVFDTLFRSRADAERADKLEKPELKLAGITPAQVPAGSADTVVTATGTGFAADSVVRFDKVDRTATFKSATELTFTVAAADLAAAGEHTVSIHNPASGGTTSNERKFTVTAVPAEGSVGTTVQVPAVVTKNEAGDLEVVSVSDETAAASGAGAASGADGGSGKADAKPDENGAFG